MLGRSTAATAAVLIAINGIIDHAAAQAPAPNDTGPRPPPFLEALLLMPIAPGVLASILKKEPGPELPPLGFWERRVGAHITGGVAFAYSDSNTWAYSGGAEFLFRGIYAELRNEHFRLPEHVEYRTARLGYLLHPLPEIAGGFTLGYRDARGVSKHGGVEIGFPFIWGNRNWWLRYEAAYVISKAMVSWNYRMQGEVAVRGGPLYIGGNVEAKTLPLRVGSKVSSVPVTVVLGVRH